MSESDLCFSSSSSKDSSYFKLLELPPDLCKLIENAIDTNTPLRLKIKGHSGDDAVLCTADQTFAVRSVALSNTVLVVTPPPDAFSLNFADESVVIRDQVTEILELTPSVPKLHTLSEILRGREYDDGQQDDESNEILPEDRHKRYTYDEALRNIQASDAELDHGLKNRHILNINGEELLYPSLSILLNNDYFKVNCDPSLEILSSSLADDHEVPRSVSTQVMSWFGTIKDGKWKMEVDALIKEVGLGILRHHQVCRRPGLGGI
ncbi:hypothetical protein H0H81_011722 [Sphagnurus paluster]|uniref:Sister chromatid cohesion protein DCC1 n=1 Tax=Sphagnurus paluster TaxID=117069 RepID=A0A9P7GL82_9AGAR|nr:hypothetical protein H0H81_011722 [Sphagnurus paluster]